MEFVLIGACLVLAAFCWNLSPAKPRLGSNAAVVYGAVGFVLALVAIGVGAVALIRAVKFVWEF